MRALPLALVAALGCSPETIAVSVDPGRVVAEVSPRYLSFSIDSSNIARDYDFSRPRLRRMAAELAPAVLRIGGTLADKVFYDLSDAPIAEAPAPYEIVLTRAWWDAACDFADELGLEILFTLDAGPGPRGADGRWTPDNARPLVAYTRARACPVTVWELGNEINGFVLAHGFSLDGDEYAADVAVARSLVDEVDPGARLAGPASIYWPLWGEIVSTLPEFMAAGGSSVDVVTWHYYPQQSRLCAVASRPASVERLFDPANLDEVSRWAAEIEALRDLHAPTAEIWLGETGHALCGGEPELSDRFVTGFWWLDQLGLQARRGQPVSVRQALTGGRYHLIDNATLEPSPDYFNSLLWKRLMGTRALAASSPTPSLRVYAHCTRELPGAVTAVALNLDGEHAVEIEFPGLGERRELYLLTGPELTGKELRLNDVPLAVAADGAPPPLTPLAIRGAVRLPPRSYAFVVLPDAAAAACR